MLVKEEQPLKEVYAIEVMLLGRVMLIKDEQPENAL